jgi:pimeloyl-ACP methyl ester carboxylesterase
LLEGLKENNELVRFDHRGGGMSDWDVQDISFDAMVSDIGTVADATTLERFVLFGISQGCSYSVAYAAQNPERVRGLVLLGGFARGRLKRNEPEARALFEAEQTMTERGWGSPNPVYRNMFTTNFIPDATPKQKTGLDELQRVSLSAGNAARVAELVANIDVCDLARTLDVPTLVLHCEGDLRAPLEEGRRLAALIPGARFVALEGRNHALVEGTPAFDSFFREVSPFLAGLAP